MKQDEIIEMPEYLNAAYEGDDLYTGDQVRELIKLVADAEREACAKVCDDIDAECEGEAVSATWCSKGIRARGKA